MKNFKEFLAEIYTTSTDNIKHSQKKVFMIRHKDKSHRVHAVDSSDAHSQLAKRLGYKSKEEMHGAQREHFKKANAHLFQKS